MLIGGEALDAARALQCGLASRLGDRAAALAWARELAELAPLSLAYAKKVLNHDATADVSKDFEACWASDDAAEGQRAALRNARHDLGAVARDEASSLRLGPAAVRASF